MPAWKIDHAEVEPDGTVHVCRLAYIDKDAKGRDRKKVHQLTAAIVIPAAGPKRGPAIAALKKLAKDMGKAPTTPDYSAIEAALNEGDGA